MSECFECRGFCCRYVTVDIEEPEDWEDYDEIRWYILHRNVIVYKPEDEHEWRIEFRTPCVYLDENTHRCKEYNKRPEVCREYALDECAGLNEMSPEGCEVYLETEQDLRKYLEENKPDIINLVFRE